MTPKACYWKKRTVYYEKEVLWHVLDFPLLEDKKGVKGEVQEKKQENLFANPGEIGIEVEVDLDKNLEEKGDFTHD